MASISLESRQGHSGAAAPAEARGPRFAARRRVLIAILLCVLVGLAVGANYRPLTHYLDARSRLDKRTAEVAVLKAQNAEMQTRLSKLLQPGYLEELARQELTYSLPGEDLFIVTGDSTAATDVPANTTQTGGIGIGGTMSRSDAAGTDGVSSATTAPGDTAQTTSAVGQDAKPGFLERLLSSIANLF
jgi:cell division protein FtsB